MLQTLQPCRSHPGGLKGGRIRDDLHARRDQVDNQIALSLADDVLPGNPALVASDRVLEFGPAKFQSSGTREDIGSAEHGVASAIRVIVFCLLTVWRRGPFATNQDAAEFSRRGSEVIQIQVSRSAVGGDGFPRVRIHITGPTESNLDTEMLATRTRLELRILSADFLHMKKPAARERQGGIVVAVDAMRGRRATTRIRAAPQPVPEKVRIVVGHIVAHG